VDSNHAICNHFVNESTRRAHLTHSRCIWKSGFGEIYFNSFGRKVFWQFLAVPFSFSTCTRFPSLGQISRVRDRERRRLRTQRACAKQMSKLALLLAGMTHTLPS